MMGMTRSGLSGGFIASNASSPASGSADTDRQTDANYDKLCYHKQPSRSPQQSMNIMRLSVETFAYAPYTNLHDGHDQVRFQRRVHRQERF
jgi:hypothetical protein